LVAEVAQAGAVVLTLMEVPMARTAVTKAVAEGLTRAPNLVEEVVAERGELDFLMKERREELGTKGLPLAAEVEAAPEGLG
jgi:hypothetical protein